MFVVSNLVCTPRGLAPLLGVSFQLARSEIIVVAGPNGAGKETLCRCLGMLLQPERGAVTMDGQLLQGTAGDAARQGVIVVLRGCRVFPELTVRENLLACPAVWKRPAAARLAPALEMFPHLAGRLSQTAGTLSGGEQQMLAIGRALLADPKVLVLDSPSLGLAPSVAKSVYRALPAISAAGTAVLVTDEQLGWATGVAQRAYLLVKGQIVREGTPDELAPDLEVHLSYRQRDAMA
jgi:branched-chain amino acid transport system ATP-binding protein